MTHAPGFTAILDANVLYPAPVRDMLLYLASTELYNPKWTDEIQDEWIRNLLLNRTDLKRKNLLAAQAAMNDAFPDANITQYEALITSLSLPDENDRHILAAAIKDKVDVIVTFNIKDFPVAIVRQFDIEIQHPDYFVSNLIQLDALKALEAFENQVRNLKNPPKNAQEVLATLSNAGLIQSASKLKTLLSI
jgi:hypothetical protein